MATTANPSDRRWRSLFLVLVLFAITGEVLAATGQVTITGPVPGPNGIYEATGDFFVVGTYMMSEDNTPTGTGTYDYQVIHFLQGKPIG